MDQIKQYKKLDDQIILLNINASRPNSRKPSRFKEQQYQNQELLKNDQLSSFFRLEKKNSNIIITKNNKIDAQYEDSTPKDLATTFTDNNKIIKLQTILSENPNSNSIAQKTESVNEKSSLIFYNENTSLILDNKQFAITIENMERNTGSKKIVKSNSGEMIVIKKTKRLSLMKVLKKGRNKI